METALRIVESPNGRSKLQSPVARAASSAVPGADRVLTPQALAFLAELHGHFDGTRRDLLDSRIDRQRRLHDGDTLSFPKALHVREAGWTVAPAPADLRDRRVEITGPAERKMMINALNSGARGFMADFEDALTPSWANIVAGQVNLLDAVRREIAFTAPDGRAYELTEDPATLHVRPRGWHLDEPHVRVAGQPVAGALVDFGLHVFHNANELLDRGSGPYLYLPKLENRFEARLWNEVFAFAQHRLDLPKATIKATVLIETLPAAFEMDEILYELRDHAVALNAGRWDYIFSAIKCLRHRADCVLPDRSQVTMTVPFMRAYTELLVATCHRRGAHAIGGMAPLIPSRRDAAASAHALAGVQRDKEREAGDGFDGTWVAHPDLVPVATAVFDRHLAGRPNQVERRRDDVVVEPEHLLDLRSTPGSVTETGVRGNVSVGLRYIAEWLRGNGAVAIDGLMEDAATAEIARSQVWQWVHHGVAVDGLGVASASLVRRILDEELERSAADLPAGMTREHLVAARELFEKVALEEPFVDFLTLPGYGRVGDL
jgi:malate synthase